MVLYGSSFSPYVRKTLAYAAEKGLKLEVSYRCRAAQPLSFQPTEDRAAQYVSDLKVEQRDGVAEAH